MSSSNVYITQSRCTSDYLLDNMLSLVVNRSSVLSGRFPGLSQNLAMNYMVKVSCPVKQCRANFGILIHDVHFKS